MRIHPLVIALSFTAALAAAQGASAQSAGSGKAEVTHGKYLAEFGGCSDCHTPKLMTPNGPAPDQSRLLSGHPSDAPVPPVPSGVLGPTSWGAMTNGGLTAWAGPWGISFAANITPDKSTGIGSWTFDQFSKTMRTGKHFGVGRPTLPPMPWFNVAVLNDADLKALFAYLQSIKPLANAVPQPIAPK